MFLILEPKSSSFDNQLPQKWTQANISLKLIFVFAHWLRTLTDLSWACEKQFSRDPCGLTPFTRHFEKPSRCNCVCPSVLHVHGGQDKNELGKLISKGDISYIRERSPAEMTAKHWNKLPNQGGFCEQITQTSVRNGLGKSDRTLG